MIYQRLQIIKLNRKFSMQCVHVDVTRRKVRVLQNSVIARRIFGTKLRRKRPKQCERRRTTEATDVGKEGSSNACPRPPFRATPANNGLSRIPSTLPEKTKTSSGYADREVQDSNSTARLQICPPPLPHSPFRNYGMI